MKTSDLIEYLVAYPDLVPLVGEKVVNSRVPTKDAVTGEVDHPFIWLRFRNDIQFDLQNPQPGQEPMGKVWDCECVGISPDVAEQIRDVTYKAIQGLTGAMGSAQVDQATIQDQADDYVPRNLTDDSGLFVSSVLIQIIGG